jgi:Zinc knuckle
MPDDERNQASLTLEGSSYFQGSTSVDEYVDNFRSLVTLAGLNVERTLYADKSDDYDDLVSNASVDSKGRLVKARLTDARNVGQTVVLKFRRGLRPAIERKVAEAEARPANWDIVGWYTLAKRFEKHEREDAAFRGAQRSTPTLVQQRPAFVPRAPVQGRSFFPAPVAAPAPVPVYAPRPAAPAAPASLHPGVPMDIDTTKQKFLARRLCYTCGQAGHFSAACPNRQREHLRVMDMTAEDWAEIAEAHAAFQDLQSASAEVPTEEDFLRNQE